MITYWKMKSGCKLGEIKFLSSLSPCQIRRVEDELNCELVQVLNSEHPHKIYKYKMLVDGELIKVIDHIKILTAGEKLNICNAISKEIKINPLGISLSLMI